MLILATIVGTLLISKADMDIVSRVVAGEARNQRTTAIEGVCHVIYNRLSYGRQASYGGVVKARRQFSALNSDDPNRAIIMADSFRRTKSYDRAGRICRDVFVGRRLTSSIDITNGADHYYSGDRVPYWARGHTPTVRLGAFKFFKLYRKQPRNTAAILNASVRRSDINVPHTQQVKGYSKEDRQALNELFARLAVTQ